MIFYSINDYSFVYIFSIVKRTGIFESQKNDGKIGGEKQKSCISKKNVNKGKLAKRNKIDEICKGFLILPIGLIGLIRLISQIKKGEEKGNFPAKTLITPSERDREGVIF